MVWYITSGFFNYESRTTAPTWMTRSSTLSRAASSGDFLFHEKMTKGAIGHFVFAVEESKLVSASVALVPIRC